MNKIEYIVEKIDGDYAYLVNTASPSDDAKCVARAFLPDEIMEGSKVIYEMMSYYMAE